MNTLSKCQVSGKATGARSQPEQTLVRIEEVLQHFDVLSSRADKHIVRYAYLYFLGTALLGTVLLIVEVRLGVFSKYSNMSLTLAASSVLLAIIGISLILGFFNAWQGHVPHILRDVFERRRIAVPAGDVNTDYLGFLEHYRDALRSPRRYLLIGSLEIIMAIFLLALPAGPLHYIEYIKLHPNSVDIVFLGIFVLLLVLLNLGFAHGLGIMTWTLIISGWHIRELSQAFEFRIEPVHPDNCGGLQLLGNFCFGAVSPLCIAVAYFSGYVGYLLVASRDSPDVSALVTASLTALLFLLCGLPIAILAIILPSKRSRYKNRASNPESLSQLAAKLREIYLQHVLKPGVGLNTFPHICPSPTSTLY